MIRLSSSAAILVLFCVISGAGCTSVKSTALKRNSDNSFVGASNGSEKAHGAARAFKGIPITLEIPSHVDVEITETYYIELHGAQLREVAFDPATPRNLDVVIHPIKTRKAFTVDFVRPAAGTLETDLAFSDDQYLTSITNKLEDKTIKDITAAIQTLTPLLTKKAAAAVGENIGASLIKNTRTVAFERFDIDEPGFEDRMLSFVELHLNACHGCEGRIGPQAAEPIPHQHSQASPTRLPALTDVKGSAERQAVPRSKPALKSGPFMETADFVVYRADQPGL